MANPKINSSQKNNDTIAAISTPMAAGGGIGIVRMSGPRAIEIAARIFRPKSGTPVQNFKSFTVHYGTITDTTGKMLDEALLTVMKAPKTYTKEDVAEISCHGGPVILKEILEATLRNGARLALPGEFTRRAFLNGRIDLTQAEAVCGLIGAKTAAAARLSARQLAGTLSEEITAIRRIITDLLAVLEADIDFPEDTRQHAPVSNSGKFLERLSDAVERLKKLLATAKNGRVVCEGVKVGIAGKPNTGKSSLLNRLLSEERAIVTPVAGTTRDVVSETFNLNGIPVTIMDTAGIRSHAGAGAIERIAHRKSREALEKSDVIIFVCDLTTKADSNDSSIAAIISRLLKVSGRKLIMVFNKMDKVKDIPAAEKKYERLMGNFPKDTPKCLISALKNKGIDALLERLYKTIYGSEGAPDADENHFVTSLRHEKLIEECLLNLSRASKSAGGGEFAEFTAFHLKRALDNLGELTGETTGEDILNIIFSKFCIGK